MPIIFVSLNKKFIDMTQSAGYQSHLIRIEDYKPDSTKVTYYVSPANTIGFMDGGIDMALSTYCFPDCEKYVMKMVREKGKRNLIDRKYLPIGSSMLYDHQPNFHKTQLSGDLTTDDFKKRFLMICPTMLLPQNVYKTDNAYYATMSLLYNILEVQKKKLEDVNIIMTSFCCGYGKMYEEESFEQIMNGIKDYKNYHQYVNQEMSDFENGLVFAEPNLDQQPKFYCNSEYIKMSIGEMETIN